MSVKPLGHPVPKDHYIVNFKNNFSKDGGGTFKIDDTWLYSAENNKEAWNFVQKHNEAVVKRRERRDWWKNNYQWVITTSIALFSLIFFLIDIIIRVNGNSC